MATYQELFDEGYPHFGTLVLNGFQVMRLDNIIDEEDDFYWVYTTCSEVLHSSCVGGFIPLKGVIPQDKYNHLEYIFNLNCMPDIIKKEEENNKKNLKEIISVWNDKDGEMFQEKNDVFDFMNSSFDFLLALAKKNLKVGE